LVSTAGTDISDLLRGASHEDLASCYDGVDNGGVADAVDCADDGCAPLPTCCLVVARDACCEERPAVRPLDAPPSCPGSTESVTECFGRAVRAIGHEPLLRVLDASSGDVTPTPGSGADVGVVFDGVVRARGLRIRARVTLPVAAACPSPCNDYLGVGLLDQRVPAGSFVRPAAGAVVALGRREVQLVVDGEVAERVPFADTIAGADPGASPVAIELAFHVDAAGAVRLGVRSPEGSEWSTRAVPGLAVSGTAPLEVAVWGRSSVREPRSALRLGDLTVQERVCETPSLWTTRAEPVGLDREGTPAAPSLAFDGDVLLVAYERSDAIHLARAASLDPLTLTELPPSLPGLRDPELVVRAPDAVELYAADPATGCIVRARGGLHSLAVDEPNLFCPAPMTPYRGFDGPSVLPAGGREAVDLLFVRGFGAEPGDGELLVLPLPMAPTLWTGGTDARTVLVRPSGAIARFDADEVAAPDAVRIDGAVQLWYAGRTGSRWRIGMIASDAPAEGLWREVPDVTFAGSGVARAFDALSVRAPSVLRDAQGVVHLLYEGWDGVRGGLGHATRLTTTR
jgi:hypothetical protein